MNNIKKNIQYIHKQIRYSARNVGRNPENIMLIAVTKNQSIDAIRNAIFSGQLHFGENYAQEALKKIHWFRKNRKYKPIWHFIGAVQSNKSKIIAENFDWCHTVYNDRLVYRLNSQRPNTLDCLNVLIQINISNNQDKIGIITVNQMFKLASIINQCSRLKLRGIMSMSVASKDFQQQLLFFKTVYYTFFQQLKSVYASIDILSLGMSNDYIAAIHSGSNLIRIGTAIFGPRLL